MRIGMQTWGSHGDSRPMLALAAGQQEAGDAVRLVVTCVDSGSCQDLRSATARAVAAAMARENGVAATAALIAQRSASAPAQERAAPLPQVSDQALA